MLRTQALSRKSLGHRGIQAPLSRLGGSQEGKGAIATRDHENSRKDLFANVRPGAWCRLKRKLRLHDLALVRVG